ncbi:MAG: biopolymer transporter ExbD [Flavobacteriales bacterium]|nr:biopolymer transporter ExbD [Flavobacteriales bacterium]
MAEIVPNTSDRNLRGVSRKRPVIDMTPMVDLAFLLLTFFVLAATLTKPKVIEIIYPEVSPIPTPIESKNAITLLLGKDIGETYYYEGIFKGDSTRLIQTTFSPKEFRSVLLHRNASVIADISTLRDDFQAQRIDEATYRNQYVGIVSSRNAPMVIVKTQDKTPYERIISAMDELNITEVRKRAVQRMTKEEQLLLEERKGHDNK